MIFIVLPVLNRLECLVRFAQDLKSQDDSESVVLCIVDSGSTDGTVQFAQRLRAEGDLKVVLLEGEPSWWWGRAVAEGVERSLRGDFSVEGVLLMNDDVRLPNSYLRNLRSLMIRFPGSVITSCLKESLSDSVPFHFGVTVNESRLEFCDFQPDFTENIEVFQSDTASGRGTYYPIQLFHQGLRCNYRKIPHYLADYDMGLAARRLGAQIIGTADHFLVADRVQGNARKYRNRLAYLFNTGSPGRLLSWWAIWRSHFSGVGRPVLLLRFIRLYAGETSRNSRTGQM